MGDDFSDGREVFYEFIMIRRQSQGRVRMPSCGARSSFTGSNSNEGPVGRSMVWHDVSLDCIEQISSLPFSSTKVDRAGEIGKNGAFGDRPKSLERDLIKIASFPRCVCNLFLCSVLVALALRSVSYTHLTLPTILRV